MAMSFDSTKHEIQRRQLLQTGTLLSLALSLPELLKQRAQANDALDNPARTKSCILLWMDGGPSHIETFDPKPEAPSEVRGPFQSIESNVPGIRLSEHLALTAKACDKLAIIRSMTSPLGEHGLANEYLLTGYKPSPVIEYPSFGSIVAKVRKQTGVLPAYVGVPGERSGGSGFLGAEFSPFMASGDAALTSFQVPDLEPFPGVDDDRLSRRQEYRAMIDRLHQGVDTSPSSNESMFERAYEMVKSPDAKNAFRLSEESTETRNRYGLRTFGQRCLLARRLVERGVSFVSVEQTGWDTHDDLVLRLRDGYSGARQGVGLIPTFDQAFSALIEDLAKRDLLDQTLVIAMGEFGRTPKINPGGGRDHWPRVFSVALAGGGVRGGQVIGSSDRLGESPHHAPVTPADLAHSIYAILGIDPHAVLHTPDGRPIRINQGNLIRGLV